MDPSPMRIRRAEPDEATVLSALARESKAHWGYTDAELESWRGDLTVTPDALAGSPPAFVAEAEAEGGDVLGFYRASVAANAWVLEHCWVRPQAIGHGVGRALMNHLKEEAARAGVAAIEIDADPHAEGFYLRVGAVRVGETPAPTAREPRRTRPLLRIALG